MSWPNILAALVACAGFILPLQAQDSTRPATDSKPLLYFIVVTGGELLEGAYPDAHTPFLTRALRPLGAQCAGSMIVDDNREDIHRALRYATNRAPLVIVTGGLGPTPNDITRETLSDFTGIPLHEHPDALAEMERRFKQSRDQLRPNLRRQTLVPTRGGYFKNPHGTAVGLIFEGSASMLVAVPGPPRELQALTRDELVPFLRERFGVRNLGCSLRLRFVGAGQSLIDQTLKDHVPIPSDIAVTSLFEGGRVDFMFSLRGTTPADYERLQRVEEKVRERLSEYIYANDNSSLEDVIVQKLKARHGSLVLVEIGSGGSVAASLNGAQGGAAILAGAYVALTETAAANLLSLPPEELPSEAVERAKILAARAAAKTGSRWALAIGGVNSGDTPGSTVWVACRFPDEHWETELIPVRDPGEIQRAALTTPILDFLRRRLR